MYCTAQHSSRVAVKRSSLVAVPCSGHHHVQQRHRVPRSRSFSPIFPTTSFATLLVLTPRCDSKARNGTAAGKNHDRRRMARSDSGMTRSVTTATLTQKQGFADTKLRIVRWCHQHSRVMISICKVASFEVRFSCLSSLLSGETSGRISGGRPTSAHASLFSPLFPSIFFT